jgi:hypothetical protein
MVGGLPQVQVMQQTPFGPVLGAMPRFRWPPPDLLGQLGGTGEPARPSSSSTLGDLQVQVLARAAAAQNNPSAALQQQLAGLQQASNPAANLLAHPLLGAGQVSQAGGVVYLPRLPWAFSDSERLVCDLTLRWRASTNQVNNCWAYYNTDFLEIL